MNIQRDTLEALLTRAERADAANVAEVRAVADVRQELHDDMIREATPQEPQAEQLTLFNLEDFEVH